MYPHATIRCSCGSPLTATNADGESGALSPGDYTVCGYCGAVFQCELALGPIGVRIAPVPDAEVPADVAAFSARAKLGKVPTPRGAFAHGRKKFS